LRLFAAGAALLLLAGCNEPAASSTAPTPTPSASASPAPPSDLVVGSAASAASPTAMTVRIIDALGNVVASKAFTAPAIPVLPDCVSIVQPPVRAAAGAAYFADSAGVVHRLAPDGTVTTVATFKLTSHQQFLSFAVSPDGTKLMATIVTAGKRWTLDIETATAGGATTNVSHTDLGTTLPTPTVITGWDAAGPTATPDSVICTNDSLISLEYTGDALVHLGPDGSVLDRIGGADCVPMDELQNGTVLCRTSLQDCQTISVRKADGTQLWRKVPGCDFFEPRLSPDANAVSANAAWSVVYARNSSKPASFAREQQPNFTIVGWAGAGMLLVVQASGDLGISPAMNPLSFRSLGVNIGGSCSGCVPAQLFLAGLIAVA
jgi:hypothetical protein